MANERQNKHHRFAGFLFRRILTTILLASFTIINKLQGQDAWALVSCVKNLLDNHNSGVYASRPCLASRLCASLPNPLAGNPPDSPLSPPPPPCIACSAAKFAVLKAPNPPPFNSPPPKAEKLEPDCACRENLLCYRILRRLRIHIKIHRITKKAQ